jgi:sialate O-acetylesterase
VIIAIPVYAIPTPRRNFMSTPRSHLGQRLGTPLAGLFLAGLCASAPAQAPKEDLSLAPLFGDHAVLQCGRPVPVWGRAGAAEAVAVTFRGQTVRTVAGADGRWSVRLGPLAATAEPADLVVAGRTTLTLHDVVVGEVWLCSGQSNMEFTVDDGGFTYRVVNAEAEVAGADFPLIRQLKVERTVATAPAETVKTGGWQPASPKTVGQFTAVGYFFARDVHRALGVPVGIIDSPWGGTPIESWMSDAARNSTSLAAVLDARWKKDKSEWPPERVARYPADMAAWEKAEREATATHTKNPLAWPQPPSSDDSPARPGGLYNAMVAPLQPGALRGILWYQGESNAGRPGEYAELFQTLIRSWREGFGQGDLPFFFVQIANFGSEVEVVDRGWARLREAQAQALTLANTGMAVTIDIGDAHNVHPRNKQEVGRRLALLARAKVYGLPPEVSGPVFASAAREGRAMRVRFTYAGTELQARDGAPRALEVAGADRVFYPAVGVIETDSLLVSSPDVAEPAAVRYAWTNAPAANLYGDNGLPVVPFRSDSW